MGKFGPKWTEEDLKNIANGKYVMKEGQILAPTVELPLGNKRVKNATKVIIDDIEFDSKIEGMMYQYLKNLNIPHERQHTVILQPKFRSKGKGIRAIKWIVDFYFPWCEIVLDTKGHATEIAKIKMKMFKYLHQQDNDIPQKYQDLIIVKKQKEVEPTALILLEKWQKHSEK